MILGKQNRRCPVCTKIFQVKFRGNFITCSKPCSRVYHRCIERHKESVKWKEHKKWERGELK